MYILNCFNLYIYYRGRGLYIKPLYRIFISYSVIINHTMMKMRFNFVLNTENERNYDQFSETNEFYFKI